MPRLPAINRLSLYGRPSNFAELTPLYELNLTDFDKPGYPFRAMVSLLVYRPKDSAQGGFESESNSDVIANAWRLLNDWKIPPGLNGDASSTHSSVIVKKPYTDSIFYIVTADDWPDASNENKGVSYSVVDLRLNNGLGDILEKNTWSPLFIFLKWMRAAKLRTPSQHTFPSLISLSQE